MILHSSVKPQNDVYYLGSVIIEILDSCERGEIDLLDLYNEFKQKTKASFPLLILSLDWLFMLGIVGNTNNIYRLNNVS